MEPLTVVCWKWRPVPGYRSTFDAATVNTLRSMVARCYPHKHTFACITDDPHGLDAGVRVIPLWDDFKELRGPHGVNCYRRLRAFSSEAREIIGRRFVSLDLDVVLTGDVTPLWDREEDFVIWGDTARNTPYNGSMFLLRAGSRTQVWETFDPDRSPKQTVAAGLIGSDQAWIAAALGPNESKWTTADGVYSWRVHLKKQHNGHLPTGARAVMFHGHEDPWMPHMRKLPWIAEHYR